MRKDVVRVAVFHYLQLRAFVHETEDEGKVVAALRHAAQDEGASFTSERVEGSHGNRILILEGDVRSTSAEKRIFGALAAHDPSGFASLAATARERVDENLNLHFRLDKQEAHAGRLALAKGDDAITVRGKLRAFESKRSGAGRGEALDRLDAFVGGFHGETDHRTVKRQD